MVVPTQVPGGLYWGWGRPGGGYLVWIGMPYHTGIWGSRSLKQCTVPVRGNHIWRGLSGAVPASDNPVMFVVLSSPPGGGFTCSRWIYHSLSRILAGDMRCCAPPARSVIFYFFPDRITFFALEHIRYIFGCMFASPWVLWGWPHPSTIHDYSCWDLFWCQYFRPSVPGAWFFFCL